MQYPGAGNGRQISGARLERKVSWFSSNDSDNGFCRLQLALSFSMDSLECAVGANTYCSDSIGRLRGLPPA